MVRSFSTFLGLFLLVSKTAFTYPVAVDINGEVSRWPIDAASPEVYFAVKADNQATASSLAPTVTEAASMWSDVDEAYIRVLPVPAGEKAQITFEFVSTLNSDVSAGYAHFDEFDNNKPSHCSIKIAASGGEVTENLARTILHEFGHCLGLGHSVIPEAVMSYSLDKNGYNLSIDDEAALVRLYPEGEDAAKLPPGCAIGGGSEGLPMKRRYFVFLFFLPLVYLLYKRLQV